MKVTNKRLESVVAAKVFFSPHLFPCSLEGIWAIGWIFSGTRGNADNVWAIKGRATRATVHCEQFMFDTRLCPAKSAPPACETKEFIVPFSVIKTSLFPIRLHQVRGIRFFEREPGWNVSNFTFDVRPFVEQSRLVKGRRRNHIYASPARVKIIANSFDAIAE